jgi:hypothetical protein
MYVLYEFTGYRKNLLSLELFDSRSGFFEASCNRLHDKTLWVLKASVEAHS